jgi:cell fate (sporulation/competence/biofilm development) regulator YlbF (YheA/YmcA/DUF963 family)
MPIDTQQLIDEAEKLGQLVSQHPAIAKYKQAQQAMAEDADAKRMLADFDRQIETLGRQEQSGLAVTDAQRMQLEGLQTRIVGNPRIKALNAAQVEFVDLLRKITQTIQRQVLDVPGAGGAGGGATPGAGAAGAGAGPQGAAAAGGPRLTISRP